MTTAMSTEVWFAGTLMRILEDERSTGGALALIEQHAPEGFSPPLHVHAHEDQLLYVLQGSITARLGDAERPVHAGGSVWLPRGVPHTFRVDTAEVRLIEVTTPGGFERFHVELGEPPAHPGLPVPSPIDVPALAAGSARYGCDLVGPPMAPA